MTSVDCLMLEAKQAILDEQHRRFRILHGEGRLDEAMQQFRVTLGCANDLLNESLRLLEQTLQSHGTAPEPSEIRLQTDPLPDDIA